MTRILDRIFHPKICLKRLSTSFALYTRPDLTSSRALSKPDSGEATGISTIQDERRKNGSNAARIETDEERPYFLLETPCREGFSMTDVLSRQKSELKSELKNELKSEPKILRFVQNLMEDNPLIIIPLIVEKSGMSRTAIQKAIRLLKEQGKIERIGSKRNGRWNVIKQ